MVTIDGRRKNLVAVLLLNLIAACAVVLASNPCAELVDKIKAGQLKALDDAKALESCAKAPELEDALNLLKRKLGEVSQKVAQAKARSASASGGGGYIEPALQWAQRPENVFINVKFAH